MRDYTVPPLQDVPHEGGLADFVVENAVRTPERVVLRRRVGEQWQEVTAGAFSAEVTALAKGLVAAGIAPGDRVALMSRTRYEWTLTDFALWSAGAVSVPVYETSSAEQVEWILSDSGAVGIFVETTAHRALVERVRPVTPALREVWTFEAGAVADLVAAGTAVEDAELDRRRRQTTADDLATVIYTSGTTGRPKGCELTHGNLQAEVRGVTAAAHQVVLPDDASTLLFLPLAHVLARVIEVVGVHTGLPMAHTADPGDLLTDLAVVRPTFVLAVPRVFEKIYNSAEQKAEASGRGRLFRAAAATAVHYSESLDHGGPGLGLRMRHAVFDRLVYSRLRAVLGGRMRYAVSGGAPLGARLGHFFRGIGVTVLEGYGLTETTAGCALNLPDAIKIGTVGRPVPGTGIRIAPDGEVLVRGGIVFRGYWGDRAATARAFTGDGWFHTGDVGELDDDGFLRITGRIKEILVTAGGKNVAPAVLEDRLRAAPLVSQCMVVGDAQPYVAALITLDAGALPAWLEQHGKPPVSAAELTHDPDLLAEVQAAVDAANAAVSHAEAIKRFAVLLGDFTEEGGQLTPTMKLKRAVVLEQFAAEVDELYS